MNTEPEIMEHQPLLFEDRITSEQVTLADEVLAGGTGGEQSVRFPVASLLKTFGLVVELDHETGQGPCDLWVQSHRLMIETKRPGRASTPHDKGSGSQGSESAFEQLTRYVIAKHRAEAGTLLGGSEPIVGLITDGRTWYGWMFEDGSPIEWSQPVPSKISTHDSYSLCAWLWPMVGDGTSGLVPLPADPYLMVFESRLESLRSISTSVDRQEGRPAYRNRRTQHDLWYEMLEGSGLAPPRIDSSDLFIRHTFLVALARSVISVLVSDNRPVTSQDVLGDGFVSWVLSATGGETWCQELLDTVGLYDWRARPRDVMRDIYQMVIDVGHRKMFGEYYTPDWLAAMIVERVLDVEWLDQAIGVAPTESDPADSHSMGVLDPTCGSGTFLFWAARRISDRLRERGWTDVQRADFTSRLVHGIDIHPVAVEISRATLLRALPAVPSGGSDAVQVFQGDALLTPSAYSGGLFEFGDEVQFTSPTGARFSIPKTFAKAPDVAQRFRQFVSTARRGEPLPTHLRTVLSVQEQTVLTDGHQQLAKIIKEEGNGVWAWYMANRAAPLLLSDKKIDRIVANPPWVRMSNIQVPARKEALEELAKTENLWVGGQNATGFDVAALFVWRCGRLYLKNRRHSGAGWVTNQAAITAGNWKAFRKQMLDLTGDLTLNVEVFGLGQVKDQPFTGAKTAVWYEGTACWQPGRITDLTTRDRIDREEPWATAQQKLEKTVRPQIRVAPSEYLNEQGRPLFRNGATLFPHCLIKITDVQPSHTSGHVKVTTAKSKQAPWKHIPPQTGDIPAHWVKNAVFSNDLWPYAVSPTPTRVIIPTHPGGQRLLDAPPGDYGLPSTSYGATIEAEVDQPLGRSPDKSTTIGNSPPNSMWEQTDRIYQNNRGQGSTTPRTLLGRLDHQRGLTNQLRERERERERLDGGV